MTNRVVVAITALHRLCSRQVEGNSVPVHRGLVRIGDVVPVLSPADEGRRIGRYGGRQHRRGDEVDLQHTTIEVAFFAICLFMAPFTLGQVH